MVTPVDDMRRARDNRMHRLATLRRLEARRLGLPTGLVDATPVRARIHDLLDVGWGYEAIASLNATGTGTSVRNIAAGVFVHCEARFAPIADLPITVAVPDRLDSTMWVPALGARRRLQALLAMGWTVALLGDMVGRYVGDLAAGLYPRTSAGDWRRVDVMFGDLAMRPGPSTLGRARARARGFVTAVAWDDVDDPHQRPAHGRDCRGSGTHSVDPVTVERILGGEWRLRATPAERGVVVARWKAAGGGLNELGRLTGWRVDRYHETPAAEVAS